MWCEFCLEMVIGGYVTIELYGEYCDIEYTYSKN